MAEREWAALRGTQGHLFEDFVVSSFRSERPDTVELVPPEPGELETDLKLHLTARTPELKGSIGEGPNHSNHSNHSNSFKIGIFRNFSLENSKFQRISTFSKLSAKFRQI